MCAKYAKQHKMYYTFLLLSVSQSHTTYTLTSVHSVTQAANQYGAVLEPVQILLASELGLSFTNRHAHLLSSTDMSFGEPSNQTGHDLQKAVSGPLVHRN
jgi:hypothetical protein